MRPTGTRIAVGRGDGPVRDLPRRLDPRLLDLPAVGVDGGRASIGERLAETFTDAFLVVHDGALVVEWYGPGVMATDEHALMSITKSFVGAVAGILVADGTLDPAAAARTYVPELADGGYREATVRDLLDMRTGGDYEEAYDERGSELSLMEDAVVASPGSAPTLHDLVARTPRIARHAGPFSYRSLDTEALGCVIERASGETMDRLLERLLLAPIGCEQGGSLLVDGTGAVSHSGGLALTPLDLARFGLVLRHSGSAGEREVVPATFIRDTRQGDDDSVAAFQARVGQVLGPGVAVTSRGLYRNQFWVIERGDHRLLCLGIHGQMLYVDGVNDAVVVKLSSWPWPQDQERFTNSFACATLLCSALGGTDHLSRPKLQR